MHRFTQQAVMLFTLLTLPSAVLADRTYNIQNYPDLQNGWTLSGTITTDGTIGTIQSTNILSWTWTVTSGVNSLTFSSTDPGAMVYTGGITATGAGLFVTNQNQQYIDLADYNPGGQVWLTASTTNISLAAPLDNNPGSYTTRTEEPGSSAWLFASPSPVAVPEPSSLNIVGFGAVCGCVHVMGHKRRARRTATTGA